MLKLIGKQCSRLKSALCVACRRIRVKRWRTCIGELLPKSYAYCPPIKGATVRVVCTLLFPIAYVRYAYTLFRKGTYGRNLPQVAGILSYSVYYY